MKPPRTRAFSATESKLPRSLATVYLVCALLALLGLADAVYLTVLHLTGQTALCGGTAACSEVLTSKYSHIGPIPVAVLGILGYFSVFTFATFAFFGRRRASDLLASAVGGMFAGTLWLLFVQASLLHQFCRYCLLSAAITFLLAGLMVASWSRSGTH